MAKQENTGKLFFENYRLDKVSFELTNSEAHAEGTYPLDSVFSKKISKISDEKFEYTLVCDFCDTPERRLPYRFHTEIIGRFMLKNWESDEHETEREVVPATVLFPLLRSYAVTVTLNANREPPLIMGLVDSSEWSKIPFAN